ncbi:hypothetical protein BRD12_01315 [Halobacteriales archaeon SW_12_67_38]|nr:MAG: hypothetical protein BRD12_01315 [Halobacteriales archaeon SW_12_67_38]
MRSSSSKPRPKHARLVRPLGGSRTVGRHSLRDCSIEAGDGEAIAERAVMRTADDSISAVVPAS